MVKETSVAGVTFQNRQKTLMGIRTNLKNGVKVNLVLVREPQNPKDENAVKVLAKWEKDGTLKRAQLGYVPKDIAKNIAPLMDDRKFIKIKDFSVTNTKTVGVKMTLEWN